MRLSTLWRPFVRHPCLRPLPLLVLASFAVARLRARSVDVLAPNPSAALASALAQEGLTCAPGDVHWLRGPSGLGGALAFEGRAIVRAHVGSDPNDLYMITVRLSPEGVPLELGNVYDLTRTSSIDEESPVLRGDWLAYVASAGDVRTAVHVLDLRGRDVASLPDFTRTQKWQTELTNLQQTGQSRGVLHQVFSLDPVADKVSLAFAEDGSLGVSADGRRIVIDPAGGVVTVGSGWVRVSPETIARPGNVVTWAVDRVRSMDWVGEERMQWVKAIAFTALDVVVRARASLFGSGDEAKAVATELGALGDPRARPTYTDPEIGWPPQPIPPVVTPPLPGEGKWIALDKDPFITPSHGLPSAFVTSFVRPDRERNEARVYVTMWDPRQIALHMQAGTVEPLSATGEAGPGAIPRVPEVMRRVVAGFNGGFQAMHGEYGMQADGVLYLPPKPYAATVMELRDGTTAFGSWPGPHGDPKAQLDVPADILSYRQNLTALIEHGKFNPWGRTWWGGTPPGWQDNIHTTRSGICTTKEGFVGYFFGADVSAEALARAMLQARCDYAVHLDMNPGLVGFEFYDVEPSASFQPLARPLQADWEHEGDFSALPGFRYRARRMIRGMSEQNFPQYIHLDGRDFFYLTRRPLLPGRDLAALVTPAEPGEGVWRTKGLPQHGFPFALAATQLRVPGRPDAKLRVVRIDPHAVAPAGSPGTDEKTPTVALFTDAPTTRTDQNGLHFVPAASSGAFVIGPAPGGSLAIATTRPLDGGPAPAAAAGIDDEEGMLLWIELPDNVRPDEATRAAMIRVLDAIGCHTRAAVDGSVRALLGGTLDAAGDAIPAPVGSVTRLVRVTHPAVRMYFDTPFVGPGTWQPLQMQRIRYFNRPKATSDAGTDASAP